MSATAPAWRLTYFETYAVTAIATMLLAKIVFKVSDADLATSHVMLYPLALGGVSIIASIIGTFFVKLGKNDTKIMGALYKGLIWSGLLSAGGFYLVTRKMMHGSLWAIILFRSGSFGLLLWLDWL